MTLFWRRLSGTMIPAFFWLIAALASSAAAIELTETEIAVLGSRTIFENSESRKVRRDIEVNWRRSLSGIVTASQKPESQLQSNAAMILRRHSSDPEIRELVPGLASRVVGPDVEERRGALRTLIAIAPAAEAAIPQLLVALKDEDWYVRSRAVMALGEIGKSPDSVVPALLRAFGAEDTSGWGFAYPALKRFMPKASRALLDAAKEASGCEKANLTPLVGALRPPSDEQIKFLVDQVIHGMPLACPRWQGAPTLQGNQYVMARAAEALGALRHEAKPGVAALALRYAVSPAHERHWYSDALVSIGTSAVEAIPALRQGLQDPALDVRVGAARALVAVDGARPEYVSVLKEGLKSKMNKARRGEVIAAVGKLGPLAGELTPLLAEFVTDAESGNTQAAIIALGELGPLASEYLDVVVSTFSRQRWDYRFWTGQAIAKIDEAAAARVVVPWYIEELQSSDEMRRLVAYRDLSRLGPAAAAASSAVSIRYRDTEGSERLEAAAFLARYPDPLTGRQVYLDELESALRGDSIQSRKWGAWQLGNLGPLAEASVPKLIAALTDADSDVRRDVRRALERIGSAKAIEAVRAYESRESDAEMR